MDKQGKDFLQFLERRAGRWRGLILPLLLLTGGILLLWPGEKTVAPAQTPSVQSTGSAGYEQTLETRLTQLLQCVQGAGRTKVMVMLETAPLNIYATDTRQGMSGTEQTHVLLDGGTALTETVQSPAVGGVAVLCEGGDDPAVAAKIYEIVSSLLGLSAGRISVTKMN